MLVYGIEVSVCLKPKRIHESERYTLSLVRLDLEHASYLIPYIHVMMFICLIYICTTIDVVFDE